MRLDTVDRPDAGRRPRGPPRPGHRHLPRRLGGRLFQRSRRRAPPDSRRGASRAAPITSTSRLRAAFAAGADPGRQGRGVILSSHLFGAMPDDLEERWTRASGVGRGNRQAGRRGRAPCPTRCDSWRWRPRPSANGSGTPGHVLIAMGDAGVASPACWPPGSATRGPTPATASRPDRSPLARLLKDFRFRDLKPDTAIYGVVGNPIMHSLSPVMHNAGFRHLGIDAVYLPLQAADAADFVTFARGLGLSGASITAPFKVALMDAADELDPLAHAGWRHQHARRCATDGGTATNTDVHGFAAPLVRRLADPPLGEGRCAHRFSAPAAPHALSPSRWPTSAPRSRSARGAPRPRARSPISPAATVGDLAAARRQLGRARQRTSRPTATPR